MIELIVPVNSSSSVKICKELKRVLKYQLLCKKFGVN